MSNRQDFSVVDRVCACGCREPVERKPGAIYATDACKTRQWKRRHRLVPETVRVTSQTPQHAPDPHLKPSARRVLAVLREAGSKGASTHDLCQAHIGGTRYSARILELRQAGFQVTAHPERSGSWRYRLIAQPSLFGADAPVVPIVTDSLSSLPADASRFAPPVGGGGDVNVDVTP